MSKQDQFFYASHFVQLKADELLLQHIEIRTQYQSPEVAITHYQIKINNTNLESLRSKKVELK